MTGIVASLPSEGVWLAIFGHDIIQTVLEIIFPVSFVYRYEMICRFVTKICLFYDFHWSHCLILHLFFLFKAFSVVEKFFGRIFSLGTYSVAINGLLKCFLLLSGFLNYSLSYFLFSHVTKNQEHASNHASLPNFHLWLLFLFWVKMKDSLFSLHKILMATFAWSNIFVICINR